MQEYQDGLALYLDVYEAHIFRLENENKHDDIVYSRRITILVNKDDKYGYGINIELNEVNNIWKLTNEKFVKPEDRDKY